MRRLRALTSGLLLLPAVAVGQDGRPCSLVFRGVTRAGALTTAMKVFTDPDGTKRTFISGGVDASCAGQGNRLLADSAEHYASRGELVLINHVRYSDEQIRMTSNRMVYFTGEERLLATGAVDGTTRKGVRFRGPEMNYVRPKEGLRATSSWRAPGRPTVRLTERRAARPAGRDSAGAPDTVTVIGDVVFSENDSLVWASGNVVISRPDVTATADSARMDQGVGLAELRRAPRIVGTGERSYTVVGTEIDLWSRAGELERVRANGEARVDADSMVLTADTIALALVDGQMDRVRSWGGRARVVGEAQRIEADSLDIRLPKQTLEELHAIGLAVAFSPPDTASVRTSELDWITGDTLVATFETVSVPGDTARRTRMRGVVATGSARAFQQVAAKDVDPTTPNLSYNRGRRITVRFEAGQVRTVDVEDQASGLYLEAAKPDSARRVPPRPPVPVP